MNLIKTLSGGLLTFVLATVPWVAFAQEDEGGSAEAGPAVDGEAGVIYRKKTIVSFDDDTIDGNLTKPDGDYLEARKRLRHANLIRIRENFKEKILDSVSSI